MARYILTRLGGLAGVLLVVSIVTFTLMHLIPGGPYDEEKMPLSEEAKANILRSYGLDQPLWQQYGLYLYVGNALRFEFGYSYQSPGETVAQLIGRVWTVSLQLGALTLAVAIPVGLGLGILAARHRNSWIDNFVTLLATAGIVLPTFVVGILLILRFSNTLHWLPTGGWDEPKTWFMPVVAYALGPAGIIARFTRTCVLEGIGTDYVRTAREGPRRGHHHAPARLAQCRDPDPDHRRPARPRPAHGVDLHRNDLSHPGLGQLFRHECFSA